MTNLITATDILFVASNTTHLKMFSLITIDLTERYPHLKLKVVTLNKYYNQIDPKIYNKIFLPDYFDLERQQADEDYWVATDFKKFNLLRNSFHEVKKITKNLRPKMIVLGNDSGYIEQFFIRHAQKLSIKTILIQDGMLNSFVYLNRTETPTKISFSLARRILGLPSNSIYGLSGVDLIYVMGHYSWELFTSLKVSTSKLEITGQPRFEEVNNQSKVSFVDGPTLPKIKTILWVTQPLKKYRLVSEKISATLDNFLIEIIVALGKKYEWNILVHPSDSPNYYKEILDNLIQNGYPISITFGKDFKELYNSIDLILLYTSTLSLECMIYQKPVIFVNPFTEPDYFQFGKLHNLLSAKTPEDIPSLIIKYQSDTTFFKSIINDYQSIIINHVSYFDKVATKRIGDSLIKLLEVK